MSADTLQQEINDILWRTCDSFRGDGDEEQYKDYVLVMLFLKAISDAWTDRYEQYRLLYREDEVRIRRKLDRERFVLPDKCSFDYLYERREAPNLGDLINAALDGIETANKGKLANVFRSIDFNSESRLGVTRKRNQVLKRLLESFADPRLDLRPSRIGNPGIVGNAYEYLLSRFAARADKRAQVFFTPPGISALIARLAAPKRGERICDPACGTGSLLLRCAGEVGGDDYALFGQEKDGGTWALCMMNIFLHGVSGPRIEWCDTLLEPKLVEGDRLMRFEVVVACPPFSPDQWGAEKAGEEARRYNRWHRGVPPRSKGDYAFISHMIETAADGVGRVGVVVSHGVLFRGGAEGQIRKALLEENLLDAVIGLPPNLFFGTINPAAVLLFRRDRGERTDVLFIDASREYESGKSQNRLREDVEVEKIVETYRARRSMPRYAYLATRDEIRGNDYNLNISRYVATFEEESREDLAAVRRKLRELEQEVTKVQGEMAACLSGLGL